MLLFGFSTCYRALAFLSAFLTFIGDISHIDKDSEIIRKGCRVSQTCRGHRRNQSCIECDTKAQGACIIKCWSQNGGFLWSRVILIPDSPSPACAYSLASSPNRNILVAFSMWPGFRTWNLILSSKKKSIKASTASRIEQSVAQNPRWVLCLLVIECFLGVFSSCSLHASELLELCRRLSHQKLWSLLQLHPL